MFRRKKDILTYVFPPIVLDIIRFIRLYIRNLKLIKLIKTNRKWKSFFHGQKVFIIGNGPSLNMVNRDIFKGHKVIVMNSFERATWKDEVEIVAHCIGEPYLEKSWIKESIIENIDGTNSLSYWLHFSSKDRLGEFKGDKYLYYVLPCIEAGLWNNNKINLDRPCLSYQTTAQMAIMVALYMGFKEIALIGFDHDWLASPDYSKHFFSDEKEDTDVLGSLDYFSIIKFMQRMWHLYYKLRKSAENDGAYIYNISPKTFLDVFDKKKI